MISENQVNLLLASMVNDYAAVSKRENPVYINLKNLSTEDLVQFLLQYSLFPKNIISFLAHGAYSVSFYGWKNVAKDLRKNINEEMGIAYGEISKEKQPHYTILREAIKRGLEIDLNEAVPGNATAAFIKSMTQVMDQPNPAFVSGAAYALEATAIPELKIVFKITEELFSRLNKKMPRLLIDFFKFHINEIEVQHRDRLIKKVNKNLKSESQIRDFETGFREVMEIMDKWWNGLYEQLKAGKKRKAYA